jgi:molecular chaperone GrpE
MKPRRKEKSEEQKELSPKDSELKELDEKIDALQKEKDELFGRLQRVSADYANYQKRSAKQIADTIAYEKEKIIKTLLPVLDNFEHTLQNIDSAENADDIVKGVRIIYDQMLDTLKLHDVEQIKATGEKFDPALHQAILQRAEADKEIDIVLEEFQKGYKLNGRVIRPSKVIVNKLQSEQAVQQPPEEQTALPEEAGDLQEQKDDETTDTE